MPFDAEDVGAPRPQRAAANANVRAQRIPAQAKIARIGRMIRLRCDGGVISEGGLYTDYRFMSARTQRFCDGLALLASFSLAAMRVISAPALLRPEM